MRHRPSSVAGSKQRHDRHTEDRRRLSCHHLQSSPPSPLAPHAKRPNVLRLIPCFAIILSTTTLTVTPSRIDRLLRVPTEHHRCRRERPSSSTTVFISSFPCSFMAKSSVNHLIHDYTDVFILSRLSRVCVECDQRIDRRTHDRCWLSWYQLQSSPPLRLHLMPTSKIVRFVSPCGFTIITMTLSNTPSHIDRGRGRLSQLGCSRREGPSTASGTASTTARLIHADLLRVNAAST